VSVVIELLGVSASRSDAGGTRTLGAEWTRSQMAPDASDTACPR
jgi:hypothetical protein